MAKKTRTPKKRKAAKRKLTDAEQEVADQKRRAKAAAKAWSVLKTGAFYPWDASYAPTDEELEQRAHVPKRPLDNGFNSKCVLPYDLTTGAIKAAMNRFCDFLQHVNASMASNEMPRFESVVMQANFSSIVGEFCKAGIPRSCPSLVTNKYHNGHPDLIPVGLFPNNSVKHASEGIEIKGSRYPRGWQGHNEEACWLMVFVIASSRPPDVSEGMPPIPFAFAGVFGARLEKGDWVFSGRNEGSKRTIAATVLPSGYKKMAANWVYRDPLLSSIIPDEVADPAEGAPEQELT